MTSFSETNNLIKTLGRGTLNALYPNDFEYYVFTLELTTFDGLNTIDYITFPVMPKNIAYNNQQLSHVKKTIAGVVAIDNDTFNIKDISISGDFGRKPKILLKANFKSSSNSDSKDGIDIKSLDFIGPTIKTGYGTIKLLEKILERAASSDDGKGNPVKLYLYNQALNHTFLVKVENFSFVQNYPNSNMVWNYSINFKAIADAKRSVSNSDLAKTLIASTSIDALQKEGNKLIGELRSQL